MPKTKKTEYSKKKRSSGKRNSAPETAVRSPAVKAEIISIIVIAGAVILMLCLFAKDSAGTVGVVVNSLLISLFGLGAYILPFAVIITCLVVIFADGLKILRSHMIMLGFLFLVIISAVHLINARSVSVENNLGNVFEYISYYYNAGSAANGGLIGAVFGNMLVALIGETGAFIILITAGVVLLILITGRSLFAFLGKLRDRAGKAIEDSRRVVTEKGTMRKLRPMKVKSMSNKKMEVYDLPRRAGSKRLFNHEILDETDDNSEGLDLINERLVNGGAITRLPLPTEPECDGDLPWDNGETGMNRVVDFASIVSGKAKSEAVATVVEDTTEAERGELKEDFEITVKGIGIESAGGKPETDIFSYTDLETDDEYDGPEYEFGPGSPSYGEYERPPVELLNENDFTPSVSTMVQIKENSRKLEETLRSFGVEARVVEVSKGPTVTRYELSPGVGVKVNKISGLADDLALSLAAMSIRIEAPIPGKSAVGIELPNKETQPVFLREVLDSPEFVNSSSKLTFAVGKDIAGKTVVSDIAKMPHLLIAGSTGSGKSVCINTLITSILYKARPDEVKLLMVDPKVVELSVYNGIPHLLIPVVTDPKKAAGALNWAVMEMERRYGLLASVGTRDLKGYNAAMLEQGEESLPQIVIIIDELADLMMASGKEVEEAICRIAQKARAAGIHLIVATQRPSVNVITGTIKANVGSRLAFAVSSGIDSRTILDQIGAERLLGKGDMLFSPMGLSKPQRIQGAFISDKEVERVVEFLKKGGELEYDADMIEEITSPTAVENGSADDGDMSDQFIDAVELIFDKEKASTSMLQRYFRIGYNSAARLMEELEKRGIVGPEDGAKPRKILMTRTEWDMYKQSRV